MNVSPAAVRRLALASLVANVLIVLTGGAVRLTGSGLGCPTWPRCTEDSYVNTAEMGAHGLIEFGNRGLSIVVGMAAVATLAAVLWSRPRRRGLTWLAGAVVVGVGIQGLIGGISVRVNLNPWVVAGHFLMSMVVIAAAYALWRRSAESDAPARPLVPRELRWLAGTILAATLTVLAVGTVVTGSGPHAGDPGSPRIDVDPLLVTQLHADAVFLLLGLSIAAWLALRAVGAPRHAVRAALLLLGAELAQGLVGFTQYFTALPAPLVAAHLAGACAVWLAALHLAYATCERTRRQRTDEASTNLEWIGSTAPR
ncbi:MAG: heme A synthase [Micromonosporaceae bacterium]|nr:heme A synthase [Micromonosporaceae bacterium]